MTDLELLRQKLVDAKNNLEKKGYFLGEEGELMDLLPSMKQYEYKFQDAIEEVWPEDAWWQHTNYWDIFQESIMAGKTADEVIEDIMNHIVDKEPEVKEETIQAEVTESQEIDKIKIADALFSVFDEKGE